MSEDEDRLIQCTDRTRKVIGLSLALSRYRNRSDVEPKDLLDVIADCGSVADFALREAEFCKEELPRDLVPVDHLVVAQSPALMRLVAEASVDSQSLGHTYIGTEHILIALMRLYPAMVANADQVRAEIRSLLGIEGQSP
jgi:hypothetical protein